MDPARFTLDLAAIKAFCDRAKIPYLANDVLGQLAIPRPDHKGWAVRIHPMPERGMLTIAYPLPGRIPDDRLDDLQLAAGLLNSRTFMGAWVLNVGEGELYFRVTVLADGVTYDDAALRRLLQIVIGTVERLIPRLHRVLTGSPAATVLEEPEGAK